LELPLRGPHILPVITTTEGEDLSLNSFSEKSFQDIFKEFYLKERKVEPQPEIVDLLLSIVQEGEEANETH
jgi:exonuclease SbcD